MPKPALTARLERLIFGHRRLVIGLFVLATMRFMAGRPSGLRIDAGFAKLLPLEHPYMATFLKHQQEFGGANRVLVAVVARDGDMFTPGVLRRAEERDRRGLLPAGRRPGRVQSLFTPNVRYTEVVEDGIAAGNVIPDDFDPTPEGLEAVRRNILKAGIVGRLVANDFSGAIISAELLEFDPTTRRAARLHRGRERHRDAGAAEVRRRRSCPGSPRGRAHHRLRQGDRRHRRRRPAGHPLLPRHASCSPACSCSSTRSRTGCRSWSSSCAALVAVVWQLGVITLLGFGIDPMSILVPFLIFAIAVSHGVQMVSAVGSEVFDGADSLTAARNSFRRLLVPGGIALATDTIGFVTILFIQIQVIQEIAIAASLGVAAIILTNLVLLPVVLSYVRVRRRLPREPAPPRARHMEPLWRRFAGVADAAAGDGHRGGRRAAGASSASGRADRCRSATSTAACRSCAPTRATTSTRAVITSKFSIGVDILNVIVETKPRGVRRPRA